MLFPSETDRNLKGLLTFILSGKEFCCELNSVVNIIKVDKSFPNNNHISMDDSSIIHKGNVHKIIKLKNIFELEETTINDFKYIIMLDVESTYIAFFVETIVEIITMENLLMKKTIEFEAINKFKNIKCYISNGEKKIIWPDYAAICNDINKMDLSDVKVIKDRMNRIKF